MKKYFSGISSLITEDYDKKPLKGKTWEILFEELKEQENPIATFDGGRVITHKDIVVKANNIDKAREVYRLIYACWVILKAADYMGLSDIGISTHELDKYFKKEKGRVLDSPVFDIACAMAVKASYRNAYLYAIYKLYTSLTLFSIPTVDLDPYLMTELPPKSTLKTSNFPMKDIMIMSCAILIAYAAIEEMGFHTSSKWSTKYENNLQNKLLKAGIRPTKTIAWHFRGPKTYLEKSIPDLKVVRKAVWAGGAIRDVELEISHAIYCASFLRSKVAAHAFLESEEKRKRIKTLSVDDVINVQHLARQLILERLRIWKLLVK